MALQVGTRVGAYEILSPLGVGGMGEVYRARDSKLQRDVALKILPEAMARDAQRMARFEREAQVLASLNHPNIAAIYGLEESNGVHALVMELVEGETLAELIPVALGFSPAQSHNAGLKAGATTGVRRSLMTTDDALPIAKQIAEALEYAHDRGVIHRDLKPANVKITPEGTVKVLDFGLAKVLDTQDSAATMDMANSPTLSAMATQAGMILGTAAYMSPEQAKGQRVERRADIWAFGCVLYEMLSGQKPFEGETISDVLASVIKSEPDWEAIPNTTPPSVQRLIRRCLHKDQRQRLQAIGEARITIEETISGVGEPSGLPREGEALPYAPPQASPLRRALPWAAAGVFLVLAVFFAFAWFRERPAPEQSTQSLIAAPENVSFSFEPPAGAPTLSPDGTRLVFPARDASGKESLWVRPLNSLTAQRLQGTDDGTFPFWAPDSRQLGFFQDGKLKKIDVTGGPPVLLCDAPDARGGAWSNKGVIVFAPQALVGGLSSVPAAGGTPTAIATPKESGGAFSNRWPVSLPDGRHFLYLSGNLESPGTPKLGIHVGEIGSNEQKFLLQSDSQALYSPPGYLLFLRGDTLMAQRFDAGSLKLEGEAFPVAEHVPSPQELRLGLFSVSQAGLLVYATGGGESGGQLVWMDASGKEIAKVGQPRVSMPALSPDGKRLAYMAANSSGNNTDIWLMDLARGVQTRFTFGRGNNYNPVWSPDGARIAYTSSGANGINILVKNSSGSGNAEPLLELDTYAAPSDWSRDGRYILFTADNSKGKTGADIRVLPLFGERKPFLYLQTQFNEVSGVFSPDGHWVAYQSDESGSPEVYLSPFPPGGGKWQVSQGGGVQPQWRHDGSALYYLAPGGRLMEASVKEKGSAVEIGMPHEVFQKPSSQLGRSRWFAVPPDGKRFLVSISEQVASSPLTLVTNWTASLNK